MKTNAFFAALLLTLASFLTARADAEFFLRIMDNGRYTVVLDDQSITLNNGRFRFFDLPSGRNRLTVLRNNQPVFQDWIDLRPDSRTVAEIHPRRGMRVLTQFPLFQNEIYCGPGWDAPVYGNRPGGPRPGGPGGNWNNRPGGDWNDRPGDWNRPGGNWNGPGGGPRPGGPAYSMDPREFERIRLTISRESFDDRRVEFIRNVLPGQPISTAQMADLLRLFTFDKGRLSAAKIGWDCVTDRPNYYAVFDTFSFESSVRELKQHIGWR